MRRAAAVVDVAAVRLHRDRADLSPQAAEDLRCHAVGGAVGAVEEDAASREVEAGEAGLELAQVVTGRAVKLADAAIRPPPGSSRTRSISASCSSSSFVPAGPKNLIPLSA